MFTGIIFPSSSTVSLEILDSLNNIKQIVIYELRINYRKKWFYDCIVVLIILIIFNLIN